MNLDYYQLRHDPFQFPSEHKHIFLSSSHLEALAAITFGVVQRKGFLTVLGNPGLGKTTLLQSIIRDPDQRHLKIIHLSRSRVSFPELLRDVALKLELPVTADDSSGLLRQLYKALQHYYEQGLNVIFLIDEAQDMPVETLENLRLISNLETPSEKIVQIVLFGRPDLWKTLGRQELRQLKQRIAIRANLSPLSPTESRNYIRFRIEKAGGRSDTIFTEKALQWLIRKGGGVPGRIDQLCREALKGGYEHSCRPVSKKEAQKAVDGLTGVQCRRIRQWAVPSLAALLLAWGLREAGLDLDFFPGQPRSLHQGFSKPAGLPESVPGGLKRAASTAASPGKSDPGRETKTPELLPATAPAPVEKSPIPESGPIERKPSGPPLLEGKAFPAEEKGKAPAVAESRGPRSPAPKKKNESVVRRVKKGDNFIQMVREVYGASDQALLDYVKKHNPRIKDFRQIQEGEKIVFPKRKK
ncbi:MAG: AAA family ATPase [Deltaproteobacteria bacterium]|nr:AAA family ATPase [Deltaproteobacteria bacterium]